MIVGLAGSASAQTGGTPDDENQVIKNRNASTYDLPISKTYTGRSPFNGPIQEAEAPAPKPPKPAKVQPAAAAPAPAKAAYAETLWGPVKLSKKAPAQVALGDQFTYELLATAEFDVVDVVITEMLPEGATYLSSDLITSQIEIFFFPDLLYT